MIGKIFACGSFVAVALTILCLIFNSLWQFFSAKRSNSNREGIELSEARIENLDALSAEVSSIDASAPEIERVAEKGERVTSSSSIRSLPVGESGMGSEECEEREDIFKQLE